VVVKVVTPTRLLAEAADVLGAVRNDVVVIGAAALEVALADTRPWPSHPRGTSTTEGVLARA
jgi:hypothetical protein